MQVIGRSLGHKSMQSTEVYARLNDDPVRASMGKAITAMLITAEEKNDEQAEQLATSAGKIVDGGPTEKGNA
jgi:hypothetical protein